VILINIRHLRRYFAYRAAASPGRKSVQYTLIDSTSIVAKWAVNYFLRQIAQFDGSKPTQNP
jgi:hypothetical protein